MLDGQQNIAPGLVMGLLFVVDYFGAMPSFTSCVVSAEAAVDELVRVSAHALLYG